MSNTANNPTKVITGPDTRWSYCNAWEAKSINGGNAEVLRVAHHPEVR